MRISGPNYKFTSKNRGEAKRHHCTVKAFVAECVRDPRTQKFFATLRKATGLGRKATALRFIEAVQKGATSSEFAGVKHRIGSTIETYASGLTKGRYRWLPRLLVAAFMRDVGERAFGKPATMNLRLEPLGPRPSLVFEPPAGMSKSDVRRLAKVELKRFLSAYSQHEAELRRNSRSPRPSVERNAIWFYQHKIQGVSQAQLARDYSVNTGVHRSNDGHETVSTGIKKAAGLFNLPPLLS